MTITVDDTAHLRAGDRFEYIDVQADDTFEILPAVRVTFAAGEAKASPGVQVERRP